MTLNQTIKNSHFSRVSMVTIIKIIIIIQLNEMCATTVLFEIETLNQCQNDQHGRRHSFMTSHMLITSFVFIIWWNLHFSMKIELYLTEQISLDEPNHLHNNKHFIFGSAHLRQYRLNSLCCVSYWYAVSTSRPEPKSNQLVLVAHPTPPPCFVRICPQLFETSCNI